MSTGEYRSPLQYLSFIILRIRSTYLLYLFTVSTLSQGIYKLAHKMSRGQKV